MYPHTFSPPKLRQNLYTTCMDDLDTIGWDYGFSFSAYGVKIGVRVSDYRLLERLCLRIPYACRISNAQNVDRLFSVLSVADHKKKTKFYNLYWNEALFSHKLTMAELLDKFHAFSSITIAELAKEKLFIHSGVVGWRGKAILLPGISNSGKSTMVAELVKQGATYYSDEFAVIDKHGYVTAYAKPLSLRDPVTQQQKDMPIESIGGKNGICRLPVGLVIVSSYKHGTTWKPKRLKSGMGLLRLLENTHSAQRTPGRAMQFLKHVVSKADVMQSSRGEAKDVAKKILEEVSLGHE